MQLTPNTISVHPPRARLPHRNAEALPRHPCREHIPPRPPRNTHTHTHLDDRVLLWLREVPLAPRALNVERQDAQGGDARPLACGSSSSSSKLTAALHVCIDYTTCQATLACNTDARPTRMAVAL
jgi:hypothetical protein